MVSLVEEIIFALKYIFKLFVESKVPQNYAHSNKYGQTSYALSKDNSGSSSMEYFANFIHLRTLSSLQFRQFFDLSLIVVIILFI